MTALGIGGAVLALLCVLFVPWAWRASIVRKQVVVNLKSGSTLRGVIYRKRGPLLILKNPEWNNGTAFTKVDGDVVIQTGEIDFMQVP